MWAWRYIRHRSSKTHLMQYTKGMQQHEQLAYNIAEYPYAQTKIPVCHGLEGFTEFSKDYSSFTFCPYIADKDEDGWDVSTSRGYMNQALAGFLYVPVNIARNDRQALRAFFEYANDCTNIPAVNITQPHKSNGVLRELYLGDANSETNVDTLIRSAVGDLKPYDLNSTAFVEWFKDEAGSFAGKEIVLIGVGGVGEPIAKRIVAEKPLNLLLVDVTDKADFAKHLTNESGIAVTSSPSLRNALKSDVIADMIVINAAGKEGASDTSELSQLVSSRSTGSIFVDIRPHLDIPIVKLAEKHGWQAYTGYGMNARNDYVLLQAIANNMPGASLPSFATFQELVAASS